jgi:hypothetical protein
MSKHKKTLLKILSGFSDYNIDFQELLSLLDYLEFDLRIKDDHYIFTKENIIEIINIQPIGNKAKAYQVKQVRNILITNKLNVK